MEIKIKFYGNLRKFGNEFKLKDVMTTAEAFRALYCQIDGLRIAIQKGIFKIRIGRKYFSMETLKDDSYRELEDGSIIHVTPVIAGSGGVVQTVVGAVFVVVGYAFSWTGIGAVIGTIGVAMLASGVASMLAKTPDADVKERNEVEKKQSTAFSNLQNLVAQGRPVPLAYGKILVGSLVIGKGLETLKVNLVENQQGVKAQGKAGVWGLSFGSTTGTVGGLAESA